MKKVDGRHLQFDWSGTSPQSERSINFYLSETMFRMFIGYYLITAAAPYTVINDGFHDLIDVHFPKGSVLKPIRPAPISCRTHFLGRTTKPWGLKGEKPGKRYHKILYRYSQSEDSAPTEILPSKCDHIRVDPGDPLEWVTWGRRIG